MKTFHKLHLPFRHLCRTSNIAHNRLLAAYGPATTVFATPGVKFYNNCRNQISDSELWKIYHETKSWCQEAQQNNPWINPRAVFANNEISLADIHVYGFDYDYTLATYTDEIHHLIYKLSKDVLIKLKKYPEDIADLPYQPDFAVRGLHFDVSKGLLMKIDSFHYIQLGTVYRGLHPVPDDEVKALYDGTHIPLAQMNSFHGTSGNLRQMMDMFSIPEMTLLANIIEYFTEKNIPYDPEYLYIDVHDAVKIVHYSGQMHRTVGSAIGKYLESGQKVSELLRRLKEIGKEVFLITNSAYDFVAKGMNYIVGPDWIDLFDVIVTNARKPHFFSDTQRPFRHFNKNTKSSQWQRVFQFRKGDIYLEGNLEQLHQMTGWVGSSVLYFGDHVYSDLADPCLRHGWRTGAVIPELEYEINTMNSTSFKESVTWLVALQNLIENMQIHDTPECQAVIQEWLKERNQLRIATKEVFNPRFGSLFRTYHNPTYFSRRLSRFADFYTSDIVNFLDYPPNFTFYPRRSALPHENYHSAGSLINSSHNHVISQNQ
ncbi:5'-nucleotidase domain-containing protein 3-like [Ptychodera flava]|uniref:5'-nucleotidase domain-containing protein 3-like n=1 Tax=Ptychodera flava TaxID=63121 RepID=UPI003969DCCF